MSRTWAPGLSIFEAGRVNPAATTSTGSSRWTRMQAGDDNRLGAVEGQEARGAEDRTKLPAVTHERKDLPGGTARACALTAHSRR